MTTDEILSRLEGVKRSSDGWTACCPAHDDNNPSLSVSETADRVLLHCHAECPPEAITAAIGINLADLFFDHPSRQFSALDLKAYVHRLIAELEAAGAHVYLPRSDQDYAVTVGLRMLSLRHVVDERDGLFAVAAGELPLLRYYANAIAHLVPARKRAAAAE